MQILEPDRYAMFGADVNNVPILEKFGNLYIGQYTHILDPSLLSNNCEKL